MGIVFIYIKEVHLEQDTNKIFFLKNVRHTVLQQTSDFS